MRILPFIILFILILAIDWYAFQAVKTLCKSFSSLGRMVVYGLFWCVPIFLILIMLVLAFRGPAAMPRSLLVYSMAVFFILYTGKTIGITFLFGEDIVRIVQRLFTSREQMPERRRFVSLLATVAAGLPVATLLYGMVRNAYRYKMYKTQLAIDHLPKAFEGFRIIQLSDIHSGSFMQTEPIEEVIEEINALEPDLILFTGDLVNEVAAEMEGYVSVFGKLKAKYGVMSVTGNHDYGTYQYGRKDTPEKRANFARFKQIHKDMNWDLLMNENRIIERDGHTLAILGVENWSAKRFGRFGKLDKAYRGTENADVRILMSHDPTHWDAEIRPKYPDIEVTLSGHTHGAQFGIEHKWLRWSPAQFVYEQWAGLYRKGKQQLYVNRGFGFLGYPGRVGILPEVAVLELTSGKA